VPASNAPVEHVLWRFTIKIHL